MSSASIRRELQAEVERLRGIEAQIDDELRVFFGNLTGSSGSAPLSKSAPAASSSSSKTTNIVSFDAADLSNNVKKVEQFAPCFEAMVQDSKKLVLQVEDCRSLSDRLSIMVRRLDSMQSRAQQALACTEDIINLKDCKSKMQAAVDAGNLPLAVSYIRQVHDIDAQITSSSDDFGAILLVEQAVRAMVQQEFAEAIQASNLTAVVALCPLLQTLGLEAEARDSFLEFIEATVFIGVSADASSVDGATDPATGYAQSLSNIFNSTYIILQQYLPMVIQGMERSLGDVHFIKRLHAKCEAEAGLVLKRYMKFRNVKELIASLKSSSSGSALQNTGAGGTGVKATTPAEVHAMLDELALLIQYCCLYSKYLKQLSAGAEARVRQSIGDSGAAASPASVFAGPVEFDKMVDELINRYYMEGERWLMHQGARSAFPKTPDEEAAGLDECFFVLQRCGQRAVATNNIHAACAVLHFVSDLLSSQLLTRAADLLSVSAIKTSAVVQEHMARYRIAGSGDSATTGASLSKGLKSAMSLASSIAGSATAKPADGPDDGDDADDPWGIARYMEVFNLVERCTRYTERLGRDINTAGEAVFGGGELPAAGGPRGAEGRGRSNSSSGSAAGAKKGGGSTGVGGGSTSSEMDKIRLCREDFDAAKVSFSQILRQGAEKLASMAQASMRDIVQSTLGRQGPLGGVRLDLADDKFDSQPAVALLPRSLIAPFETVLDICTYSLSEGNKDLVAGLLADACCERLEHHVTQTSFGFAGALKLEECVRALTATFARYSTTPIRGKFSRLREIMLVLTSDGGSGVGGDSFSLTTAEISSFMGLRVDA